MQIKVLDRKHYLLEGYKQLSDRNYYTELENDPTDLYRNEVQNAVEGMYQIGKLM